MGINHPMNMTYPSHTYTLIRLLIPAPVRFLYIGLCLFCYSSSWPNPILEQATSISGLAKASVDRIFFEGRLTTGLGRGVHVNKIAM